MHHGLYKVHWPQSLPEDVTKSDMREAEGKSMAAK